MEVILYLSLCMHELHRIVTNVNDHFIAQNGILPLSTCLHNGVHVFSIGGRPTNNIRQCFTMIVNWMSLLNEDIIDIIVRGICLYIEWLLGKCED
jgi:hypothetical protein